MPRTTYTIGRAQDADIRLEDGEVSRRHAELVVSDSGLLHLTDCQSLHGTFVQARGGRWARIRQQEVKPHDRVRIGGLEMTVAELRARAGGAARGGADPSLRRNPMTGRIESKDA